MHDLFFPFKLAAPIFAQDTINRRAGTLAASVNHFERQKLHLRLIFSRFLRRVAHCAGDCFGGLFNNKRKKMKGIALATDLERRRRARERRYLCFYVFRTRTY